MGKWARRFVFAFQFLTRFPIRANLELTDDDFARSSRFFPFVSLATSLFGLMLAALGYVLVHPIFAVAMAVLGEVYITGALHLDGMGDTMDALGSSRSRERMLEIMKDSRMGTMGVVAIVFDLGLKCLLLYLIMTEFGVLAVLCAIVIMQLAGRICVSAGGAVSKSARKDGMGKPFIDGMNGIDLLIAFVLAAVFSGLLLCYVGGWGLAGAGAAVSLLVLTAGFGVLAARGMGKVFGGITGDTLGFLYESGAIFCLIALACAGKYLL